MGRSSIPRRHRHNDQIASIWEQLSAHNDEIVSIWEQLSAHNDQIVSNWGQSSARHPVMVIWEQSSAHNDQIVSIGESNGRTKRGRGERPNTDVRALDTTVHENNCSLLHVSELLLIYTDDDAAYSTKGPIKHIDSVVVAYPVASVSCARRGGRPRRIIRCFLL